MHMSPPPERHRSGPEPSGPLAADATVVVVGASLAGLRAAETLRSDGLTGPIVMVGAESHRPYDRPPLSKQFLAGTWERDRVALRPDAKLEALGLDLRLGCTATALDVGEQTVHLADGTALEYDGLVVATGASPRHLPGTDGHRAVHVLRTLDDAIALAAVAVPGTRMVVVGGGFIGAEVAATCSARGMSVTIVEALPAPLARALGPDIGAACAGLHTDHGVTVLTGTGVAGIDQPGGPGDAPARVHLTTGQDLDADVVVVGIGVTPATRWLTGSGLELDDGVRVDEGLFAADRVVAAGDIARWDDPRSPRPVRLEHWTNAAEQGVHAARNLLRGRPAALAFRPVPYVWSDQYDVKIQVIGFPGPDDDVTIVDGTGSLDERRFVALYAKAGQLTGAVGFGRPRQLMAYHRLLETGTSLADALAATSS